LERKCKNHFSQISSSKMDWFTSKRQNDQWPFYTHHWIHFTSENAQFLLHLPVCQYCSLTIGTW